MTMTKMTNVEINQLSYVAMDSMNFALRNVSDLQRIADTFCGGDFADAVKLCMNNGMNALLTMCDMDDDATEAGL